eukprot:FR736253.1.p1 GENE.FR736253.1~~FR736253.1.p1  ORF type:complete len:185 (+),score=10.35 FR736253.1:87-641(+)
MAKGGLQSRQSPVKAVVDFYNGLYDTKHFSVCLVVWLCGIPIALQNFQNCYDGQAHPFSTFFKSVYVSLPISTIILPGALELLWLPREQHEQWANACKKCFVSGMWNILPSAFVQYHLHGTNSWTVRSPDPHGWVDVGHFLLLLASHEFWFYVCHRINHTEFFFSSTHGHHHKNKGLVFMVNNS